MKHLLAVCLLAPALSAADISGTWELTVKGGDMVAAQRLKLTPDQGAYTFHFQGSTLSGKLEGSAIEFRCTQNGKDCGVLKGTAGDSAMSGDGVIDGIRMTWSAKRSAAPAASPARHEFTPTVFYREFSSAIGPVLRIFPGDTVHTKTVDAGGRDEKGEHRVFGGNPETGPFYVEGAMPGDTLVVKFTRVRLNRDSAVSGDSVVPSALDPGYYRNLKEVSDFDSEWKLDRENGFAMLKHPTERLKNYKVPLRPMLGCVAVAPPAGQTLRAGYLGSWGGNMDYNELRESTTVYLPVNVPGALLFIGDGHALQGDGELTGDALETSMDVEFTVSVEQGGGQRQPRFENDEYVMTSGIANSLAEAVQIATTGMSRYLAGRYQLNPSEVGIVLGTAVKYDIAELVDPLVHVVAKVPRKALEGLK